jgi:hypothetical protein
MTWEALPSSHSPPSPYVASNLSKSFSSLYLQVLDHKCQNDEQQLSSKNLLSPLKKCEERTGKGRHHSSRPLRMDFNLWDPFSLHAFFSANDSPF